MRARASRLDMKKGSLQGCKHIFCCDTCSPSKQVPFLGPHGPLRLAKNNPLLTAQHATDHAGLACPFLARTLRRYCWRAANVRASRFPLRATATRLVSGLAQTRLDEPSHPLREACHIGPLVSKGCSGRALTGGQTHFSATGFLWRSAFAQSELYFRGALCPLTRPEKLPRTGLHNLPQKPRGGLLLTRSR